MRRQLKLSTRSYAGVMALFLAVAQAAPRAAHAQDRAASAPEEPAGYRATVDEAVREFAAHNYEESRALFSRAHALFPNARTHRGLALAEFELRNYGESIHHLEAALRSEVKPLSAELRADTEAMLSRANNFVGRVQLDAKPSVSRVLVDGVVVEVPAGESLLLQVGDHTLEVQAPGFQPERRKLTVQGGDAKTLTIVLSPTSPAGDADSKPTERRWYKNGWLWAGVGAVVAGAAAGTGYALSRDDKTANAYRGSSNTVLNGP